MYQLIKFCLYIHNNRLRDRLIVGIGVQIRIIRPVIPSCQHLCLDRTDIRITIGSDGLCQVEYLAVGKIRYNRSVSQCDGPCIHNPVRRIEARIRIYCSTHFKNGTSCNHLMAFCLNHDSTVHVLTIFYMYQASQLIQKRISLISQIVGMLKSANFYF